MTKHKCYKCDRWSRCNWIDRNRGDACMDFKKKGGKKNANKKV